MIAKDLEKKWEELEAEINNGQYKILFLAEDIQPSLFLARTPNFERALVLRVPSFENIDFEDIDGENISLTRDISNRFIVIRLSNIHFKELFDYLIISICNSISDIRDPEEYSKIFLRCFYKWMQFFVILPDFKLKESVIQGIFGELIFLETILNELNGLGINAALSAWRGPYNTSQDFIFENKNVEVKTRKEGNLSVKIANEEQLDQADGKDLELAVVRLDSETATGFTLSQMIEKILLICEENLGDISILFDALRQKNLVPDNFSDYDEYVFHPADVTLFNCGMSGFPKLVGSALPTAINKVGYSINTGELEEFTIRKIDYDNS